MNKFTRSALAFSTLVFLTPGCGVKEGAEFYALQKQDNHLAESVSNLQVEVNELILENNGLRAELATNSQAVSLLIQDEREQELNFEKLQGQITKMQKNAGKEKTEHQTSAAAPTF